MNHLLVYIYQIIKGDKANTRTQQYIHLNTGATKVRQLNTVGPALSKTSCQVYMVLQNRSPQNKNLPKNK